MCIISCNPKESKDTTDASIREKLRIEQARLDAANNLNSESHIAEASKKLTPDETELESGKETPNEIEQKAIALAVALEERVTSTNAARKKLIGTELDSLTLPNGKFYNKVVIRNITDLNVSISHDSGMATIRMTELTPQDQRRFHFDMERAEVLIKAQSAQSAESVSQPPASQSNAVASGKPSTVDAKQVALLRLEIVKEENKLIEMKSGLVRLKTEQQNVVNEFDEETSNAQRIKNTRYDRISGNDRFGGISTSKADRQMKINLAAARVSSAEALILQAETRIRNLKSQL